MKKKYMVRLYKNNSYNFLAGLTYQKLLIEKRIVYFVHAIS